MSRTFTPEHTRELAEFPTPVLTCTDVSIFYGDVPRRDRCQPGVRPTGRSLP